MGDFGRIGLPPLVMTTIVDWRVCKPRMRSIALYTELVASGDGDTRIVSSHIVLR